MDKQLLIELIEKGLSQREIGKEIGKCQTTVKHWLKKYGLKTNKLSNTKIVLSSEKNCKICGKLKPVSEFYHRLNRNTPNSYCKKCHNTYHTKRLANVKLKMIEYKGNECVDCGLHIDKTHYSVFDFHHINPNEKDLNFKRIKFKSWDKIVYELDKCILLCANCHRLRHNSN